MDTIPRVVSRMEVLLLGSGSRLRHSVLKPRFAAPLWMLRTTANTACETSSRSGGELATELLFGLPGFWWARDLSSFAPGNQ